MAASTRTSCEGPHLLSRTLPFDLAGGVLAVGQVAYSVSCNMIVIATAIFDEDDGYDFGPAVWAGEILSDHDKGAATARLRIIDADLARLGKIRAELVAFLENEARV